MLDWRKKQPIPPAGKIEIEGVGFFDGDKVPKWAYSMQKILSISLPLVMILGFIVLFYVLYRLPS